MRRLIFIFALLCTPCFAQNPWSNVLPTTRAIDWTRAGLPGTLPDGETTANPWTPPVRTQSGSTINPSGSAATDLSNIQTALNSCTNGHYVLLGPTGGTPFQINARLDLNPHSCSLRGSGAQATIINQTSPSGPIALGEASGYGFCSLTSGSNFAAGSTSITVNCGSGAPSAGTVITLTQCDTGFTTPTAQPNTTCTGSYTDNGGLRVCGGDPSCMTEPSGGVQYTSQVEALYVVSVTGTGPYTVTFSQPLMNSNWSFAQGAFIQWNSGGQSGVGLEDMTITGSPWIQVSDNYSSWLKGVRVISPSNLPIGVSNTANSLFSNDYIFNSITLDSAYAAGMQFLTSSSNLILNNIFTASVEAWEGFGGTSGNVFAYNYARDSYTLYAANIFYDHHPFGDFELFEGNQIAYCQEDNTWGTHALNTCFRNFAAGYDAPYTGGAVNAVGMSINGYQRFENLIGNAIGTTGILSSYQGTTTGFVFQVATYDALVAPTLNRWGNVSVVTQASDTPANSGVRFVSSEVPTSINPNTLCTGTNTPYTGCTGTGTGTINVSAFNVSLPANHNLPCSFFLTGSSTSCVIKPSGGTGFSWWKVCKTWNTFPTSCSTTGVQPFPPTGPDQSGGPYVNGHAYDIPASIAWQYLPIDTSYQNSYTITGSSWSGQVETLTVSGLPASNQHVMGAFQLSGVNAACSTGATFGGNSEILMTGSNTTTVQYALTSNPGLSCTGSMLFPDVRQFDEQVFEADSGAGPSTISGLSGSGVKGGGVH